MGDRDHRDQSYRADLMSEEDRIQIIVDRVDPDTGLSFRDAIYLSQAEYTASTPAQLEALRHARFHAFRQAIRDTKTANTAAAAARDADPTIATTETVTAAETAETAVTAARDAVIAAKTVRVQKATKLSDLNDKIDYAQAQIDRSKTETTYWQTIKADATAEKAVLKAAKGL